MVYTASGTILSEMSYGVSLPEVLQQDQAIFGNDFVAGL